MLAFAKYTYTFGAPLKKVIEQGGVTGQISVTDETINVKGIKIIAAGKTVLTDKNGKFEFNNLALGTNYILLDQATLPDDVITSAKIPYTVNIKEGEKANLIIELVKAANINGQFEVNNKNKMLDEYDLTGNIKIESNDFTYYTESNKKGEFKFQNIVPGIYKMSVLRFKKENKLLNVDKNIQVSTIEGTTSETKIELKVKERKIRFKNKNFKVGK